MIDLITFTDADLHDLSAQIAAEWDRRRAEPRITEVIAGLQESGKIDPPPAGEDVDTAKPWVNPGTDHSLMYRKGAYVTHEGKTWLNTHPHLNHWEPGSPGVDERIWLDVTPIPIDEEPEDDVTPDPETGEPGDDVPTDPEAGEPEEQIIAWDIGQAVEVGDLRTHDGQTWECILEHTTHEGWAPGPATHTVWKLVV